MNQKPVSEMSYAELLEEMEIARQQYQAASYQEHMRVMVALQDSALARQAELQAEIDARRARVAAAGGVPLEDQNDGG
jgi:hypothetical protein